MPTGLLLPIYPDYATEVNGEDRATWTSDGRYLVYRTDFSGIDRYDLTIIAADGAGVPVNYTVWFVSLSRPAILGPLNTLQ